MFCPEVVLLLTPARPAASLRAACVEAHRARRSLPAALPAPRTAEARLSAPPAAELPSCANLPTAALLAGGRLCEPARGSPRRPRGAPAAPVGAPPPAGSGRAAAAGALLSDVVTGDIIVVNVVCIAVAVPVPEAFFRGCSFLLLRKVGP